MTAKHMRTRMQLCAGELVEVRSKEEILSTLDENGRFEGVPFMPEMFKYCGMRLRVYKRAHKTCDFVTHTGSRGLLNTVHLENARCDGTAHGNCEAQCMIFWKDVWLRLVNKAPSSEGIELTHNDVRNECSEQRVMDTCVVKYGDTSDRKYACQATLLPSFTQPLSPWDIRQYVEDYVSGNVASLSTMIPRFVYRLYDNMINLGVGWGPLLRSFYDAVQRVRHGTAYPARSGKIPSGSPTPTSSLGLVPGELVRVKAYREILETLDTQTKNRGMAFSAEMVPYCGRTFRVVNRVTKLIDEKTGKMLHLKNPCIILEGVTCKALYNKNMIFCPRATYAYWREIWLERVGNVRDPKVPDEDCRKVVCEQARM